MSYDLRIYFPHEEFPLEEWRSVLSLFDVEEFVPEPSEYDKLEMAWYAKAETRTTFEPGKDDGDLEIDPDTGLAVCVQVSPVHIDLLRVSPEIWGYCTPVGSQWKIRISTSGRICKVLWTQFAIPYYALGVIEGLTVHDCQWHNDENMYRFQDAEEWAKFASCALASRGWLSWDGLTVLQEWKDRWVQQGLITEGGRVLF